MRGRRQNPEGHGIIRKSVLSRNAPTWSVSRGPVAVALMMAERENMEDLYQIKDIIKENKDGDFLAICESGNYYECKFVAKFRAMFFAMPEVEKILGYTKIIERI